VMPPLRRLDGAEAGSIIGATKGMLRSRPFGEDDMRPSKTPTASPSNVMIRRLVFLCCLLDLVSVLGCGEFSVAGGGANRVYAPAAIIAGQENAITMTFSAMGNSPGDMAKSFTKIVLHYVRSPDGQLSGEVNARIVSSNQKTMEVEFLIPPVLYIKDTSLLCSVTFLFDGHPNATDAGTLPISKPSATPDKTNVPTQQPNKRPVPTP